MARRALFIVNDPVATGGLLSEAFADNGFDVDSFEVVPWARVDDPAVDVTFPDPVDYDAIVPLGARWAVYDDALRGSWLDAELRLLQGAHDEGVPVLGVCFGGQLLAIAHGGNVSRSPTTELGWYDLDTDDPALVPEGPWFQWHFDRWTLPPGATEISRNPQASQAFVLGANLALQFHPELDYSLLLRWLADDREGDVAKLGVNEHELLARTDDLRGSAAHRVHQLVRGFIDRAGDRAGR